jgi:hypothetical protein
MAILADDAVAGCVDSGELFRGGRAGPQHLMLRALGDGGVGQ